MARDPYYLPQPTGLGKPAAADIVDLTVQRGGGGVTWTARLWFADVDGNQTTIGDKDYYLATGGGGIPSAADILAAAWDALVALGAVEGAP